MNNFFFFAKKQKKKEKKILQRDSNPGTSFYTVGLRVFSAIAPRELMLKSAAKLINFDTYAHEILPVDAVWSR